MSVWTINPIERAKPTPFSHAVDRDDWPPLSFFLVGTIFLLAVGVWMATTIHAAWMLLAFLALVPFAFFVYPYLFEGRLKQTVIKIEWNSDNSGSEPEQICSTFAKAMRRCREAYHTLDDMCCSLCDEDVNKKGNIDAMKLIAKAYNDILNNFVTSAPYLQRWGNLDKDSRRRIALLSDRAQARSEECMRLTSSCANRSFMDSPIAIVPVEDEIGEELAAAAKQWEDMLEQVRADSPLELGVAASDSKESMRTRTHDLLGVHDEKYKG